jgi:hypothetical protein
MPMTMTPSPTRALVALIFAVCVCSVLGRTAHAQRIEIPLTPDRWRPTSPTGSPGEFKEIMGARGVLLKGVLELSDFTFGNGVIELDIDPGGMGAGLVFRRSESLASEVLYFRPKANCAQAYDCVQYTPIVRGVMLWDMFPQHQAPAPLRSGVWNHVKVVVSGQRMRVFVNRSATPTLEVGRLESGSVEGTILLMVPGAFANVTVTPNIVEGLASEPEPDSTSADGQLVRHWQIAPASVLPADKDPAIGDMPGSSAAWQPVVAERGGVVNITRLYGRPAPLPSRALAWLKTTIVSDAKRMRKAEIGWLREMWVFVNGRLVYMNRNVYDAASERKPTDGRLALDNGSFVLPLEAGANEIAVAVVNEVYGWGLMLRLDGLAGVTLETR